MALRDLLMLSALLVMVPMIFFRPHVGLVLWAWTAMLAPNTFLYGIGASVRYNLIFAVATLIAWLISKEPKRIPLNSTNLLLFFFLFWVCLATVFGVAPFETRMVELSKLIKIVIFTVAISVLATNRLRVHALLLGIALGMGYHGASEGAKFILSGGNHHVFGPARSIIGDNNHFALGMTFLLPILIYLYAYAAKPLARWGLFAAGSLVFVSIIGTFSRGGLIGLGAAGLYGLWKSKHKILTLVALCIGIAFVIYFAPERWFDRMSTIQQADQDGSFMGRVVAWKISTLLALDHPILGGGMLAIQNETMWSYYASRFHELSFIPTPDPDIKSHAAHSVYFQLLADVGFVGLGIFLVMMFRTWRSCNKLIKQTAGIPELEWINSLSRALQVSLIAYAVSGAALNMAYFEMYYVLIALVAVQESLARQYKELQAETDRPPHTPAQGPQRAPARQRPATASLDRRRL